MKVENALLMLALILALIMRLYPMRLYAFVGNDPFVHASVIRQYLETGNLDTYELTGGIQKINEPKGLYWVAILPALIGVPYVLAFQLMPVVFGAVAVALAYYFLKNVFDKKTALIGTFILALSVAHTYRTMANFYRGDGFFLTFLLGVMLAYTLVLKEKKTRKQVLLSFISAFLVLGMVVVWNGHLLGIAIIVFWLLVSEIFAYYEGNRDVAKKLMIYGSIVLPVYVGMNFLLMQFNVISNLFFYSAGAMEAYVVFVLVPAILGPVFYYGIRLKKKHRIYSMIGLLSGALIFAGLNAGIIEKVLSQSIFFKSAIYTIGVSELLPPTPELVWVMHNIMYYFMWAGFVIFGIMLLKLRKIEYFVLLSYVAPVLFLMLNYGRYAFLGSFVVASMAGLAISYMYGQLRRIKQLKKVAICLPIGLLVVSGVYGAYGISLFTPRISEGWVSALKWVKGNLEPGKVVCWWDHGSWIQYYTGFPTVVDSVYGQVESNIQRIAKFFVTDSNDTFKDYNASYLILGDDAIYYIGAILGLANESEYTIVFPQKYGVKKVQGGEITVYYAGDGQFELYNDGTLYRSPNGVMLLRKRVYVNKSGVSEVMTSGNYTMAGCLIINPYAVFYANDKACNSNLIRLLFGKGKEGYKLLYANDFVRVYGINE